MKLTLRIWRQTAANQPGNYERHQLSQLSPDISLLEAVDQLADVRQARDDVLAVQQQAHHRRRVMLLLLPLLLLLLLLLLMLGQLIVNA